jgi:hypothetical protein
MRSPRIGAALGASLRRGAGRSPPRAAPASASRARPSAWPSPSSCPWSSSTCSAAAPRPGCPPRPSRPTCCRRSTAATASRRWPSSPPSRRPDCFDAAYRGVPDRGQYRHPVILLSDGYLANGSEPWRCPTSTCRRSTRRSPPDPTPRTPRAPTFHPYLRDEATLARPGPSPARPRPRAPHRRHREGRRPRLHLLRPRQPREVMVRAAAGQGGRRSPRRSRLLEVDDPDRRRRTARARLGLDVRPIGAACEHHAATGPEGRTGAPAPPQPAARNTWARC